jgi:hypothetical protein
MPKTRKQRGGVRSASLFKRGPSLLNKVLRRSGTMSSQKPLPNRKQNLLAVIAANTAAKAAGKSIDQIQLLNRIKAALLALPRDAVEPVIDSVQADLQGLIESHATSAKQYDQPFVSFLMRILHRNRMPSLFSFIDELTKEYDLLKRPGKLHGYLSTYLPIEFAKELNTMILKTIKAKKLFQTVRTEEEEQEDELADLMTRLGV